MVVRLFALSASLTPPSHRVLGGRVGGGASGAHDARWEGGAAAGEAGHRGGLNGGKEWKKGGRGATMTPPTRQGGGEEWCGSCLRPQRRRSRAGRERERGVFSCDDAKTPLARFAPLSSFRAPARFLAPTLKHCSTRIHTHTHPLSRACAQFPPMSDTPPGAAPRAGDAAEAAPPPRRHRRRGRREWCGG